MKEDHEHVWSENGVYCVQCGQRRVGEDIARIVRDAIWEARDLFRSRQHDNHEMAGAIINRTIDALISSAKPGEWRPIESAPKDGTRVLGFCRQGNHPGDWAVCRWSVDSEEFIGQDIAGPTLWMPLPATPTDTKED